MELTYSDVEAILKLVDSAEHLEEIEIVYNGFRLRVVRDHGSGARLTSAISAPQPSAPAFRVEAPAKPAPTMASVDTARPTPSIPAEYTVVRAPMLGTFYRSPAPGEKPFVEVGQKVRADDTVCLIEVMKLFNSIRAGIDGEIVEILADNGALVEHDQPLIVIAPRKG